MKKSKLFKSYMLATVTASTLFAGCNAPSSSYVTLDGFALGTTYHIVAQERDSTGLNQQIEALFNEVVASMSVYEPNSLLNRLNRNETDSVDKHIAYCIEIASQVSDACGGVYDITIKPLTEAWGFTGRDAVHRPNTDSLLQYVGYRKIAVKEGRLVKEHPQMQIELNSIAKGYTVDLLGELLQKRGITNYLVEVGGEIVCRGVNRRGEDWVVAIDRPAYGNNIAGEDVQVMLSFTDKGLATSGNYRKFYLDADGNKVVHTVNAVTGESKPSNLLSATVIAENCTMADAYGTMMMAIGFEKSVEYLEANPELMGYLVYAGRDGDFETYVTSNLRDKIRK